MRRFGPLVALLVVSLLGWWGADAVRREAWVTADEPDHVRACRELRSGPGVVSNFEHPVLAKVLGAAGLAAASPAAFVEETRGARRLFPVVFALLVFAAGYWTYRRSGAEAGLAVASLLALEPTLRGHAPLVHTDLLLTALLLASAAALDLSGPPRAPRPALLLLSGSLYGLALASKYSALPFLAIFLLAATVRLKGRSPSRSAPPQRRRRSSRPAEPRPAVPSLQGVPWRVAFLRSSLLVGLPALVVAAALQQGVVALSTRSDDLERGVAAKFRGYEPYAEALQAVASLPRGAAAYRCGLLWVRASSVPGSRPNYFLGEVSGTGRVAYFPVALALKLTTATVLLLAASGLAAALASVRARGPSRRRLLRLLAARSGLPAFLAVAYLGAAMTADVNIGVRHVMPAVPLALVASAGALRTLLPRRPRTRSLVLAAVVLAAAGEGWAARGREIPFGNLLAGGPGGVHRFLSDSNVDWGQAQGRLFARVAKGDLGRVAVVALQVDPDEARRLGVEQRDSIPPGAFDTVFVSTFLRDLGRAAERSPERTGKVGWLREWLVPLLHDVDAGAASVEPFGEEYVLYRMKPAQGPPSTGAPQPGPTP